MDAIVDHLDLCSVNAILPANLLLEDPGDGDEAIGGVAGVALDASDSRALPAVRDIAATARLRRVHCENAALAHGLQLADRRADQPVVAVDDVEAADVPFHVQEVADEGAAHVLDLLDEVAARLKCDLVVLHAPHRVLPRLPVRGGAGEDVDVVAGVVQSGGQLCDMWRHAPCGDCVQRLPREHGDLERSTAHHAILRRLHATKDPVAGPSHLRVHRCAHQVGHSPILVPQGPQDRAQVLRQGGGLAHVEAKATLLDGMAHARKVCELVGDGNGAVANLVHQAVRHHEVVDASIVQLVALRQELVERNWVGRLPHAMVLVDHAADALEPEAVDAVLRHPELQAGQQVPEHLVARVVEEPRPGHRVEALLAFREELAGQAVFATSSAVVRDAEQDL
mmetsp:Transcript_126119/g.364985  ORF Transcript_126119/g.364985 Transcript_126119/m.364985 type:complete len:395 (+) Transcript_126119:1558-2742(+)